jgi:hypothetical protein
MAFGIPMFVIGAVLLVLSRRVEAIKESSGLGFARAYQVMAAGFILSGAYPIWPPALTIGVVIYGIGIALALRAVRRRQNSNRRA